MTALVLENLGGLPVQTQSLRMYLARSALDALVSARAYRTVPEWQIRCNAKSIAAAGKCAEALRNRSAQSLLLRFLITTRNRHGLDDRHVTTRLQHSAPERRRAKRPAAASRVQRHGLTRQPVAPNAATRLPQRPDPSLHK
jgi:hypothetical protein